MNTIVVKDNFKFDEMLDENFSLKEKFQHCNIILMAASKQAYRRFTFNLSFNTTVYGREFQVFDRNRISLNNEKYLIINSGQEVESYGDGADETKSFSVIFNDDFANDALNSITQSEDYLLDNFGNFNKQSMYFFEKLNPVNEKIRDVVSELKDAGNETGNLNLDEQLHSIISEVVKDHRTTINEINKLPFTKKSTRIEIYRRLNMARDFIDSCFFDTITLNQLSSVSCMAEHHFLRHFKNLFGITPHQYVTHRRLEEAKQLLRKTGQPVNMIIHNVGFECPSAFGRLFKQHTQMTPAGFRGLW